MRLRIVFLSATYDYVWIFAANPSILARSNIILFPFIQDLIILLKRTHRNLEAPWDRRPGADRPLRPPLSPPL